MGYVSGELFSDCHHSLCPAEPIPTPAAVEENNPTNSSRVISTQLISPRVSHSLSDTVTFSPTDPLDNGSQQNQSSPPIALIVGVLLSVLGLVSILASLVVVVVARAGHCKMKRRKRTFVRPQTNSMDYNDIYESSTNLYSSSR